MMANKTGKSREEIEQTIKLYNGSADVYSDKPSELFAECLRDFLKEELIFNNITQKKLAQEAKVNERTISRIMNCKCTPYMDTLVKIYDALGLTVLEADASIHHLMQGILQEKAESKKSE